MLLNCFAMLYCLCVFGLVGLMVLANCLFMYLAFVCLRLVFVLVLAWVWRWLVNWWIDDF